MAKHFCGYCGSEETLPCLSRIEYEKCELGRCREALAEISTMNPAELEISAASVASDALSRKR